MNKKLETKLAKIEKLNRYFCKFLTKTQVDKLNELVELEIQVELLSNQ